VKPLNAVSSSHFLPFVVTPQQPDRPVTVDQRAKESDVRATSRHKLAAGNRRVAGASAPAASKTLSSQATLTSAKAWIRRHCSNRSVPFASFIRASDRRAGGWAAIAGYARRSVTA
jgi:hypothetical protein